MFTLHTTEIKNLKLNLKLKEAKRLFETTKTCDVFVGLFVQALLAG